MSAIRETMSAISSILRGSGSARQADYQTLPTSEDDRTGRQAVGDERKYEHDSAVYLSFWLFGAGCLLGWSALMCTFPLLVSFYPADSITGQNLPSLLSTVYCLGQLIFLGIAQRQVGQKSPTAQIRWSLLLLIATFILTTFPLLPLLLPSLSTNLILPILLVIVFFLNLSTSYFQSAALALASLWGSSEILAALSGQGGVAVLISLFQLVLAVIGAFGTGAGTGGREGEEVPSMLAGVGLWGMGSIGAGLCWLAFRFLSTHPAYERVVRSATEGRGGAEGDGKKGNWNRTVKVLKKNKLLYLAVALDFAVTLSVFPAITSLIVSTQVPTPRLLRAYVFIPLHFFIFNAGDYIGRTYLPSVSSLMVTSHPKILGLSISRLLFIPLFLGCNLSTSQSPSGAPWINSDLVYLALLILFGITNGFIGSLSIIVSSTPALNPRLEESEKDVAGTMGVFCLMAGLTVGSMASFGVNHAVRG